MMESETVEDVGDVALVETPHVAMVWEGLEELKDSEAEENNEVNLAGGGGYNRAEVRDYKMPRRKTTKRRKARKVPETDR